MTHKFDSGIHDLAVCKKLLIVCIATFALSITLVDARVKKDEHFENKKCYFGSK